MRKKYPILLITTLLVLLCAMFTSAVVATWVISSPSILLDTPNATTFPVEYRFEFSAGEGEFSDGSETAKGEFSTDKKRFTSEAQKAESGDTVTLDYNGEYVPTTNPTRVGYDFMGYKSDNATKDALLNSEKTKLSFHIDEKSDLKHTFYLNSVWNAIKYTINFDTLGKADEPDPIKDITIEADHNTAELPVVKAPGYKFIGWEFDYNEEGKENEQYLVDDDNDIIFTLTEDIIVALGSQREITLSAIWEAINYRVYYEEGKGDTSIFGDVVTNMPDEDKGEHHIDDKITIPSTEPSRIGFIFLGWKDKDDNNSPYYKHGTENSVYTMLDRDVTFVAQWQAIEYNIVFDNNGVTHAQVPDAIETTLLKDDKFASASASGYIFEGWKLDGSGEHFDSLTVALIQAANLAENKTENVTITLKADFKELSYTIQFITTHNDVELLDEQLPDIEDVTLENASEHLFPKKDEVQATGYTFNGWKLANDTLHHYDMLTYDLIENAGIESGTITLYADWTANEYTLIFENSIENDATLNDEPLPAQKEYTLDMTEEERKFASPVATGYNFVGWKIDEDGVSVSLFDKAFVKENLSASNEITLKAYWSELTYTIVYDAGEFEDADVTNEISYTGSLTLTNDKFMHTGYALYSWKVGKDGTEEEYVVENASVQVPIADVEQYAEGLTITFTAQWRVFQYKTKFVTDPELEAKGMPTQTTVSMKEPSVTLTQPLYAGYDFMGWTITAINDEPIEEEVKIENNTFTLNEDFILSHSIQENDTITFTAKFTPHTNHIYYKDGVGEDKIDNDDIVDNMPPYDGECVTDAMYTVSGETPVREGFTFGGWAATDEDGEKFVYDDNGGIFNPNDAFNMPAGNITLTAVWNAVTYTITLSDNKHVSDKTKIEVTLLTSDDNLFPSDDFKAVGYIFDGWFLNEAEDETPYTKLTIALIKAAKESELLKDNAFTLYAKWTTIQYTIAFKDEKLHNEGASHTYTLDEEGSFPPLTSVGYEFNGWSKDKDEKGNGIAPIYTAFGKDVIEAFDLSDSTNATENITLYANWTTYTYTAQFDDGTSELAEGKKVGDMPEGKIVSLDDPSIALTTPTLEGYEFHGWTITANDIQIATEVKSETYLLTAKIITQASLADKGSIIFTATWGAKQYNVTYADGKTGEYENDTVDMSGITTFGSYETDVTVTIPEKEPTRKGFIFGGWKATSAAHDFGDTLYKNDTDNTYFTMPAGDVTLTAQWTMVTYTITFTLGDHAASGENASNTKTDISSGYTFDVQIIKPAAGYTFGGWTDEELGHSVNGTTTTYTLNDDQIASDSANKTINLVAVWNINTYNVVFASSGIAEGSEVTYNNDISSVDVEDEDITLEDASAVGYNFTGWSISAGSIQSTELKDGIFNVKNYIERNELASGTITLTANFTAIDYTLTFNTDPDSYFTNDETAQEKNADLVKSASIKLPLLGGDKHEKGGYKFEGWTLTVVNDSTGKSIKKEYTISDGEISFTLTQDIISACANGDNKLTFNAKWSKISYTVNFEKNNDYCTANPGDLTGMVVGGTITFPKDVMTATGYNFLGWKLISGEALGDKLYNESTTTLTSDIITNYAVDYTITFVAQWQAIEYTIKFASNYAPNGSEPVEIQSVGDIKADANGFSMTISLESANKTIPNATAIGYTFNGWYLEYNEIDDNGTGTRYSEFTDTLIDNADLVDDKIITLYAKWTAVNYTIQYKAVDETNEALNDVDFGNRTTTFNIETSAINLGEPKYKHYDFIKWTLDFGDETTDVNDGQFKPKTFINDNYESLTNDSTVTLTAHFTAIIYTVNFNSGDHAATPNQELTDNKQTTTAHTNFNIMLPIIEADAGYEFTGWQGMAGEYSVNITADEASGKYTLPEELLDALDGVEEHTFTLIAEWKAKDFEVTYKNGIASDYEGVHNTVTNMPFEDSGFKDPTSHATNAEFNLASEEPKREGYTFLGWYATYNENQPYGKSATEGEENSTDNGKYYAPEETFTMAPGNVILTAVWSPNYTIKFVEDAHNSTVTNKNTSKTIHVGEEIAITDPSAIGYTFDKWTVTIDDTTVNEESLKAAFTGGKFTLSKEFIEANDREGKDGCDITFIAEFKAINYNLAYETEDGETDSTLTEFLNALMKQKATISLGKKDGKEDNAVELGTPTLAGFSFKDWSISVSVGMENKVVSADDLLKYITGDSNTFTIDTDFISNYINTADNIPTIDVTITFTATWKEEEYKVKFDLGDVVEAANAKTNNENSTFTAKSGSIELKDATALGYVFTGWKLNLNGNTYKEADGSANITIDTAFLAMLGDNRELTFTAQWEVITYTVEFKTTRGEEPSTITITIKDDSTIDMPDIDEAGSGYKLISWTASDDSGETIDLPIGKSLNLAEIIKYAVMNSDTTATITLTAKWAQIVSSNDDIIEVDYLANNSGNEMTLKTAIGKALVLNDNNGTPLTSDEMTKFNVKVNHFNSALTMSGDIVYGGTYIVNVTITIISDDYTFADGTTLTKDFILKYKSVQISSDSDNWYTIEDALNTAEENSNEIIIVKYNTTFATSDATSDVASKAGYKGDGYYTVKNGVTLLVPGWEKDTTYQIGSKKVTIDKEIDDITGFVVKEGDIVDQDIYMPLVHNDGFSSLMLQKGIELTVNGTLTVNSLRLSGGSAQFAYSVVDGKDQIGDTRTSMIIGNYYGTIELADESHIELSSTSTMNAMGFIHGAGTITAAGSEDGSTGAKVVETFALPGWKGDIGTIAYYFDVLLGAASGSGSEPTPWLPFPLDQYTFSSIMSKITFNYGSSYDLYASFYVAVERYGSIFMLLPNQQFDAKVAFIAPYEEEGKLEGSRLAFIQMKNTEGKDSFIEKWVDDGNGKVNFVTHGDMNFFSVTLPLNVDMGNGSSMPLPVTTQSIALPIPGNFSITIEDGDASVPEDVYYKLLPGATWIVGKNATMTFESGSGAYSYGKDNYSFDGVTNWQDADFAYPIDKMKDAYYNSIDKFGYTETDKAKFIVKGRLTFRAGATMGAAVYGEEGATLYIEDDADLAELKLEEIKSVESINNAAITAIKNNSTISTSFAYQKYTASLRGVAIHGNDTTMTLTGGLWNYKGNGVEGKWIAPKTYIITYDFNNSTQELLTVQYYTGTYDKVSLNKDANKRGYEFVGWKDKNGEVHNDTIDFSVLDSLKDEDGVTHLTAQYNIQHLNLRFELEGEEFITNSLNKLHTYTIEDESWSLPEVNPKTGYKFSGWYTSTRYSTKAHDSYTGAELYTSSRNGRIDVTFYGKVEKITYNVTFKMLNDDETATPKQMTIGDEFESPQTERKGYVFVGWRYGDNIYTSLDESLIIAASLSEENIDITLVAEYEPAELNIVYSCNTTNASVSSDGDAKYTISKESVTLRTIAPNSGYKTDGKWYYDEDCTQPVGDPVRGSDLFSHSDDDGTVTLYAKVEAVNITVVFKDGESEVKQLTTNADKKYAVTEGNIKPKDKDHHLFDKWISKERPEVYVTATDSIAIKIEEIIGKLNAHEDTTITFDAKWKQELSLADNIIIEIDSDGKRNQKTLIDEAKAELEARADLVKNLATGNNVNAIDGNVRNYTVSKIEFLSTPSVSGTAVYGGTYQIKLTVTVNEDEYYFVSNGVSSSEITKNDIYLKYKSVEYESELYTIEDALKKAESGTITVKYNTSFATNSVADKVGYTVANGNYTVKQNVTLLLPYSAEDTQGNKYLSTQDNPSLNSSYNASKYLTFKIPSEIQVSNEGTITVGAVTGATNTTTPPVGGISAGYSEIEVVGTLNSTGTLNVYGNIVGSGKINATSGTVRERLEILDWPGGRSAAGRFVGNKDVSAFDFLGDGYTEANPNEFPFEQYRLQAIKGPELIISYGTKYLGNVRIYTGEVATSYGTLPPRLSIIDLTIVTTNGGSSDGLFRLKSGSTFSKQVVDGREKITVKGGTDVGVASINMVIGHVEVLFVIQGDLKVNMDSSNVKFPIPSSVDLVFDGGNTELPYGYELMGTTATNGAGATVKLVNGATITLNDKDDGVIGYSGSTIMVGANSKLIVNGTFGAVVEGEEGAQIIVNEDSSLSAEGYIGGTGNVDPGITCTCTFSGTKTTVNFAPTNQDKSTTPATRGTYYYHNNKWVAPTAQFKINYSFLQRKDDIISKLDSSDIINGNKEFYTPNDNIALTPASLSGWTFMGWYSDALCTIKQGVIQGSMLEDITVYGLFEKVEAYVFNYIAVYEGETISIASETVLKLEINDFKPDREGLANVYDYDVEKKYYFGGWYLDESKTQPYDKDALPETNGGSVEVTLYAKWKEKVTLTIKYTATGKDGTNASLSWNQKDGEDVTLQVTVAYSGTNKKSQGEEAIGKGGTGGYSWNNNSGSSVTKEIVAYLMPGQTYNIITAKSSNATITNTGNLSGEAGEEPITVTITAT